MVGSIYLGGACLLFLGQASDWESFYPLFTTALNFLHAYTGVSQFPFLSKHERSAKGISPQSVPWVRFGWIASGILVGSSFFVKLVYTSFLGLLFWVETLPQAIGPQLPSLLMTFEIGAYCLLRPWSLCILAASHSPKVEREKLFPLARSLRS